MVNIKYCLALTAVVFIVGGMWFPIFCGTGVFSILNFLAMGIAAVALTWGGGGAIYILTKKTTDKH